MTWLQRNRVPSFFRESVWVFPVLGILASFAIVRFCVLIEGWIGWEPNYHPVLEGQPNRITVSRRGVTILAVDTPGLVALVEKYTCIV